NAVEFSQPGGGIKVTLSLEDNTLRVTVRDYGLGIAEQHLENVFNRFTQLDATSVKEHGGHGLGLSIVKALLEVMGGAVSVSSKPKKGSIFTITIPEAPATEEQEDFDDGQTLFFTATDSRETQ
ncbi:MAG: ATP-binding protein, partial [Ferruginibacter sp.]|nr:ATP-binding protein [Cytophagales bacterium]